MRILKRAFLCLTMCAGCLLVPNRALAVDLRVCQSDPARYGYRLALSELVLSKTGTAGAAADHVRPFEPGADPGQDRCLKLLRQGEVDLVYLPPSEALLDEFLSVKVDLHFGMLGFRLLLIHRKDQALFAKVNTLADLRRLQGGFSPQWSDFKLFALNRLPVVTATNATTLLSMLNAGRFHYFHRGLHEAWSELERHPDKANLMVEPHLALVYKAPVYFMFKKTDAAMAQRFERGLRISLADGSLRALFQQHFGGIAARTELARRQLIPLEYPLLAGLPEIDTEFWLK